MGNDRFSNIGEAHRIFALQHHADNLQRAKDSSIRDRLFRIRMVERYLLDRANMDAWTEALRLDLGRAPDESRVIELLPILVAIKHIQDDLHRWVRDAPSGVPLALLGVKAHVHHEPKGHVLVIGPWNYPLQLTVKPMLYALAAGNVVLIKPSEIAQHTSAFVRRMIGELFDEREVAVVEGDVPTTTALLEQPFHHVFFTGSPAVGKVVMQAAARNLTSVTLELGGKSPVVVDATYDPAKAGRQVAWGKCLNKGQTCIAPDYVLIHRSRVEGFVRGFQDQVRHMYDPQGRGLEHSKEYGRMVNDRNFQRVKALIHDAVAKGARVAVGGGLDESQRFIAPHVLLDVTPDMAVMQEEIFGPVLPVIPFDDLAEVPAWIARLERPLTMYILSHSRRNIRYLMQHTTAGSTAINELMITMSNPMLPAGGVNGSGIGKSNGRHAFIAFSNERAVQRRRWGTIEPVKPPFRPLFVRWAMRLARW